MGTDSLEPEEQAFKFILPRKDSLYGTKPLSENLEIEHGLSSTLVFLSVPLVGIDIWFHACIEDLLTVDPTIVHAIKAHGRSFEVEPHSFCNELQWAHCLSYKWGFVLVTRCKYHRRYDIAVAITYGYNLITFHVLMTVVA